MKKWIIRISIAVVIIFGLGYAGSKAYFEAMKKGWIRYNEYDVRSNGMLSVGDLAPDLELAALEGEPTKLSSYYQEKPLVLVFGSYT